MTQLQIRRLLDDLDVDSDNEFVTLDPDSYDGSPKRVAQVLRAMWRIPDGPIPDLVRVVEAAGGVVVFRRFGTPKLDGMSCWPRGGPPLFFINSDITTDRARMTLAHELGHLVMHFTPPNGDPEAEANEFAAEFLAPAADVASDLRNLRFQQLPGLKAKWRMSMAALIMSANRLGILPPSRVRSLWVQLSRAGYRTVEPFPLSPESAALLDEAIRVHRVEHEYSIDQLAQLTDLYPSEFASLYGGSERQQRLSVYS